MREKVNYLFKVPFNSHKKGLYLSNFTNILVQIKILFPPQFSMHKWQFFPLCTSDSFPYFPWNIFSICLGGEKSLSGWQLNMKWSIFPRRTICNSVENVVQRVCQKLWSNKKAREMFVAAHNPLTILPHTVSYTDMHSNRNIRIFCLKLKVISMGLLKFNITSGLMNFNPFEFFQR